MKRSRMYAHWRGDVIKLEIISTTQSPRGRSEVASRAVRRSSSVPTDDGGEGGNRRKKEKENILK